MKWPNDVLIGEKKIVGILVERIETPDGPAAVVGVGLNVSLTVDELPVPTGTSLAIEAGVEPDRTALLVTLLRSLWEAYDAWQAGGEGAMADLRTSYAAACVTVGRDGAGRAAGWRAAARSSDRRRPERAARRARGRSRDRCRRG